MIVKMFQPRFAQLVESGVKCQTVRPLPKRWPKPGCALSLRAWTEKPYRSKKRILRETTLRDVQRVKISESGVLLRDLWETGERFSKLDGFKDFAEMLEWFKTTHGLPFEGVAYFWPPIYAETTHSAEGAHCAATATQNTHDND